MGHWSILPSPLDGSNAIQTDCMEERRPLDSPCVTSVSPCAVLSPRDKIFELQTWQRSWDCMAQNLKSDPPWIAPGKLNVVAMSLCPALPPALHTLPANRSKAIYCDSVGCEVPESVGPRHFSLLRMGWAYSSHAWLGVSNAWAKRRMRQAWRCGREGVFLNLDMLTSLETLTQAAEPLQRLSFEGLKASEASSAFSVDHQVFGSYGSIWSFFAMADTSRWTFANGSLACAGACAHVVALLHLVAEVDTWRKFSPARRLQEMQQVLAPLPTLEKYQDFHPIATWAWQRLADAWKEDSNWILAQLTETQRSCFDALAKMDEVTFESWRDPPPECQASNAMPSAFIAASMVSLDRSKWTTLRPSVRPGHKWRICGMPGDVVKRDLGLGGRLEATVSLGDRGLGSDVDLVDLEDGSAWEVELSLFVAPKDPCVLVDGQRLFQTHPQSYLTQWSCSMEDGTLAVSQGVVSYSGTVALLRCRFAAVPSRRQPVTLTVSSTVEALRAAGWSLSGLRLCPFQPLEPVVPTPGPSRSPYARKLVVCSEVLYGLKGTYKSALVRHWLEYHRLIGVDHFVIYDRDGSLEVDGVLQPYILNGYVTYFPRFSYFALSEQHDAVHAKLGLPSAAAPDAQAASHCLFMQRGLAEWVSFLHSPDEYLSNERGLRHVEEVLGFLRPLREKGLAALDVREAQLAGGGDVIFLAMGNPECHKQSPIVAVNEVVHDTVDGRNIQTP
eukprot:s996_g1.t1